MCGSVRTQDTETCWSQALGSGAHSLTYIMRVAIAMEVLPTGWGGAFHMDPELKGGDSSPRAGRLLGQSFSGR